MSRSEETISIVGKSGVGKSSLGRALGIELRREVIDVGEFFREALRKKGMQVQEGDEIPLSLDREVDAKSVALLGKQVILVGRTVTWLARKEQKRRRDLVCYGVGVTCSLETLVARAIPTWNEKKHMPPGTPPPSPEHVREKLFLRDAGNMSRYGILYNIKSEEELYGAPPNDIVIHSDEMDIGQEVETTLVQLYYLRSLTR